jgi:hypothetical protein
MSNPTGAICVVLVVSALVLPACGGGKTSSEVTRHCALGGQISGAHLRQALRREAFSAVCLAVHSGALAHDTTLGLRLAYEVYDALERCDHAALLALAFCGQQSIQDEVATDEKAVGRRVGR